MNFTKKIMLFVMAIAFSVTGVMAVTPIVTDSGNALQGIRVLYVYGGWYGHEPEQNRDIFVPWLISQGAIVHVHNTLAAYDDAELMANIDLIIQHYTMGGISGSRERALLNAVRNGVGLAGWHGGIGDSFRNNVGFQYMVGGQWVAHPGNLIDYTVNMTSVVHPITYGIGDFRMYNTEQYLMHVDPNNMVLATTTFSGEHDWWIEGKVMPVVWVRMHGHGRVFYSSLGHVAADFDTPQALEITKRGIIWAAGSMADRERGRVPQWVTPVYRGH